MASTRSSHAPSKQPAHTKPPATDDPVTDVVSDGSVGEDEDETMDFFEDDEEEGAPPPPSALAALADPSAFPLELLRKLFPAAGSAAHGSEAAAASDEADAAARLAAAPASSTGHTQCLPPPSALLSKLRAFAPLTSDPTAPAPAGFPSGLTSVSASNSGQGPSEEGLELTRAQAKRRIAAGGDVIQMTLALGVLDIKSSSAAPASGADAADAAALVTEATEAEIAEAAAQAAAKVAAGEGQKPSARRQAADAGSSDGLVLPAALARALARAAGRAGGDESDDADEEDEEDDDEEDCDDDVVCRAVEDDVDSDDEIAAIHSKEAGKVQRRGPKKPNVVPVVANANGQLPLG